MFSVPCVLRVRTNDTGFDEVLDIYMVKSASVFTYHSLININSIIVYHMSLTSRAYNNNNNNNNKHI